uniref:Uncharacterized protein n=1 Tax=Glossina pallidipes TaxID=7398 RepID=A0A1A9ZKX8_GLOPL
MIAPMEGFLATISANGKIDAFMECLLAHSNATKTYKNPTFDNVMLPAIKTLNRQRRDQRNCDFLREVHEDDKEKIATVKNDSVDAGAMKTIISTMVRLKSPKAPVIEAEGFLKLSIEKGMM